MLGGVILVPRPYEIGIGAYSKVNIKYINPLTYDSITKIALF
jgi:hypothetical protein